MIGVPLADTGRGSLWKIEDWTNNRVYDGLRIDLENSNPDLVTVGRPNILGSIHAMKSYGHTTCSVRSTVEKSAASDAALCSSHICLRGGNRVVRLWTEQTPAKVCNNCLQLRHFATLSLCAFPPIVDSAAAITLHGHICARPETVPVMDLWERLATTPYAYASSANPPAIIPDLLGALPSG